MIDFQDRLADLLDERITALNLDIPLFNDNNGTDESLALYSLPGGAVIRAYMDETKEKQLNYEIQGKSKDRDRIFNIISAISDILENVENVESANGSYDFQDISVSSEPYFNESETDGYLYFRTTFQVKLTIYKGEK